MYQCPLIFQAFSADDKLFIGNGQGDTEENRNKDLLFK